MRNRYKNNKLKIIAPTWNHEFGLPNDSYSVSDIKYYIEFFIKKHKAITAILLFMFTSKESIID